MALTQHIDVIPHGQQGLDAKIWRIRELVNDAVRDANFRQMVVEQLGQVRERDWDGEVKAVVRFVQRMRFTRDPFAENGLEVFIHPKAMMLQIIGGIAAGDCDDHVLLATAMLEVIGYETRYRVGGPRKGQYQHIWIDVKHPTKGWIPVELIKPGIKFGFDPSPLFNYTETHAHQLGDLPTASTMRRPTLSNLSTTTMVVRQGGRPSSQIRLEQGFSQPLPSDYVRDMKAHERRAGISVSELANTYEPSQLGFWPALIMAMTTAGSAYHAGAQRKREVNRQRREQQAALYQRRPVQEWATQAPPPIDYTQYAMAMAQAGTALYSEYSYDDTQSNEYWEAREQQDLISLDQPAPWEGPMATSSGTLSPMERQSYAAYRAGEATARPDFDRLWMEGAQQRRDEQKVIRQLANTYRQQTTQRGFNPQESMRTFQQAAPGAQMIYNRYRPSGRITPPVNFRNYKVPQWVRDAKHAADQKQNRYQQQENYRQGYDQQQWQFQGLGAWPATCTMVAGEGVHKGVLVPRLQHGRGEYDFDQGYVTPGLSDLGQDPIDPGKFVETTKDLALPKDWKKLTTDMYKAHAHKSKWWKLSFLHPRLWEMLKSEAVEQGVGNELEAVILSDIHDPSTTPSVRTSGRGGGAGDFEKHWGSGMLSKRAIQVWMNLAVSNRHPDLSKDRSAPWDRYVRWFEEELYVGANAAWKAAELRRWEAWDEKKQTYNEWAAKKKGDTARQAAAAAAAAAAQAEEDRQREIREEALRVKRAREDAERAKAAAERARLAEERRMAYLKRGMTPPPVGQRGSGSPPLKFPTGFQASGISPTVLIGAAAVAAFFIWKK